MSADSQVMAQAFQAGAGFEASVFSDFLVTLIAVVALVWTTILVIGWLHAYKQQRNPAEFIITRLMALGMVMALIFSVLGSSFT